MGCAGGTQPLYVIEARRSLVIEGWDLALGVVLTALSLRAIATYDR